MKTALSSLYKRIDKQPVLEGIDFEFQPRSINVIIGPNGAGKTTLLRLVGLLEKPDHGKIFFDTLSAWDLKSKEKTNLRRRIGFVFQQPLMLEGNVLRNLTYGLHVRKQKIDQNRVLHMLQKVGLQDKINQEAKKLSGGEKQRLQLARVMLLEPELYLLDEPTANLDPLSTRTIENIIMEMAANNKTVVFSTHNLVQARLLGQKFFFLKAGRLVQQGTGDEIFQRPVSLAVAEFSSVENIIYGEISTRNSQKILSSNGLQIQVVTNIESGPAAGVIRAEDILLSKEPIVSSARNSIRGKIQLIADIGMFLSIAVSCEKQTLISFITRESAEFLALEPEQQIYLTFKSTAVHILKTDSLS